MARRPHTTICLEGLYYLFVTLFILGGAALREVSLLVILAGMMLGPFLFNWRLVGLMLRNLGVDRRVPTRVCVGDLLTVPITLSNRRRHLTSWMTVLEDRIQHRNGAGSNEATTVRLLLSSVPPRQNRTASYQIRPLQRGRYRIGPLRVSTRFPLGLARASWIISKQTTFLACPRSGRLSRQWKGLTAAHAIGSQQTQRQHGALEGDYYGLRDWRSGDSRRWIHWRTSAKRNELSVRQFEQQRSRDLVLVLDLWQPDVPDNEDLGRTETAISFMATAVADICRNTGGQLAVAVAAGNSETWVGPSSRMLMHEVWDYLALVAAHNHPPIDETLRTLRDRSRDGIQVIVISTRPMSEAVTQTADDRQTNPGQTGELAANGKLLWIDGRNEEHLRYFDLDVSRKEAE